LLLAATPADLVLETRRHTMMAVSSAAPMARPTGSDNFGARTDPLFDAPRASAAAAGSRAS